MKIYNTLTRQKDEVIPITDNLIRVYSCGLTVYDYAHIGNLRKYIFDDVLARTLKHFGYRVSHVINITDVGHLTSDEDFGEDKIEKGSKREGKSAYDIAQFYEKAFINDLKRLNVVLPDYMPRATEHIDDQIALIKKLEEKGYTYRTSDGIYFDTAKFSDYGKLGNIDTDNLKEGARVDKNNEKKNPADFALWKFSYPDGEKSDVPKRQMEWDSPWGVGFPGWHIECSAMSTKYLGQPFEIHTGGVDHIGTHHNNEIAQSEAAEGKPLAKYFVHSEHLLENGKKMAKSSGGFLRLKDIKDKGYSYLDFRYLCIGAQYRSKLDFSWKAMDGARSSRQKIQSFYRQLKRNVESSQEEINFYRVALEEFDDKLADDLNTPAALSVLFETIKKANDLSYLNKAAVEFIDKVDDVLAILEQEEWERKSGVAYLMGTSEEVIDMAIKRNKYRDEGNFEEADVLRTAIDSMGYVLEDEENITIINKKT